MVLRGVPNSVSRATRTSRTLREVRPFSTSCFNPSRSSHLASSHRRPVSSILFSRPFTLSCPRYRTDTVIRVPTMAESITEGTLTQFSKQVGDFIEQDEELATIETDKIDVSVNAPYSGIIQRLLVADGDIVTVDQAIAELRPEDQPSKNETKNGGQYSSELPSDHSKLPTQGMAELPTASVMMKSPATIITKSNSSTTQDTKKPLLAAERLSPNNKRGENRVCSRSDLKLPAPSPTNKQN